MATVHWQTDKWIDLQRKYFARFLEADYRVYAYLNDIPARHASKFDAYRTTPIGPLSDKLNDLAELIGRKAKSDDDILIFIDGDAFPIAPMGRYLREKLERFPLVAMQRLENYHDSQPHPAFCATTVGFWKRLPGDWGMGHHWDPAYEIDVYDQGTLLLAALQKRKIPWYPMLRTNSRNLHPVFFGVYDHCVYHHGAGFRSPLCRADTVPCEGDLQRQRELLKRNGELSRRVFAEIEAREEFYEDFIDRAKGERPRETGPRKPFREK